MKHSFRIIIGMLLFAIPLCLNAQVKPTKPENENSKTVTAKPAKTEETQEKAEKAEKEKVEKPKGEIDRMPKISGFVQGMFQANLNSDGELVSNTFRMRRVRMSIDGTLAKGLTYKIQGDFVRSPMLVDAFVKYKACDAFAIQLGQFKLPFTIESPINPVNLEIFDYGESVQKLAGYSDVCGVGALGRDIGIMATGSLFPVESNGQRFGIVDYSIGVFNGNGPNVVDNNNHKDISGRLDIHPWLKALTLSGSFYYGEYKKDDNNQGARNRWTAGVQYNDGNFVIRAEYLNGTTGYYNDIVDNDGNPIEQYRLSNGYYAVTGYNFKFGKEGKKQQLMPVLRYEHFEPGDMNLTIDAKYTYYTVGINYWPVKSLNFKLDYSLIQQNGPGNPTLTSNSHRVVGILSYKF